MDVRKQLGFRTIFNLIGPLANPASVKRQLIGVASEKLVPIFVKVIVLMEIEYAMIVNGKDGMDEISIAATNQAFFNNDVYLIDKLMNAGSNFHYTLDDIKGGDANYNATALRKMLLGDGTGAFAEAARVNAAAGLIVSGKFTDFGLAYAATKQAIESHKAYDILHQVMAITNEHA
jgi:anthranilate phosphoribosyltransferase